MKELLSTLLSIVRRSLIFSGLSLLTFFILAHTVEKVLLTDLPYVNSVNKSSFPSKMLVNDDPTDLWGFYGEPTTLRIPNKNGVISLQEAKKKNGKWLVSNTLGNMTTLSESKSGLMGTTLVYSPIASNTMSFVSELRNGDRLVVDTQSGWKYQLRVVKKVVINKHDPIYIPDTRTLVVLAREINDQETVVAEAQLLTMQENI